MRSVGFVRPLPALGAVPLAQVSAVSECRCGSVTEVVQMSPKDQEVALSVGLGAGGFPVFSQLSSETCFPTGIPFCQ